MTKQEFIDFCHEEFIVRGFKKKKNMYYLQGEDILCGLYLQKSMGEAFYVEYSFFIGDYSTCKKYPTRYEADINMRIGILSKQTINGERFMGALIEYEQYTKEEIKIYFDKEFSEHILPIIKEGKKRLIQDLDYFFDEMFESEIHSLLDKLNNQSKTGDGSVSSPE